MTKLKRKYINLFIASISTLLIFLINGFEYYSNIFYDLLFYGKEALLIMALLFSTLFWKGFDDKKENDITYLLKNILGIIIVFYATILIKIFFFRETLYTDFFPEKPVSIEGLVLSTIISFFIIFLLPPLIILLKNLFLYKRKRLTPAYFYSFIVLTIISSLIISMNQDPTPEKVDTASNFNKFISYLPIGYSLLLSFRHKWVTYLPKKHKYIFSAISLAAIPLIITLFNLMHVPITGFSIFLYSFTNIIWWFLIFYTMNSVVFLWLQLPTASAFEKKMKDLDQIHRSSQKLIQMASDKNLYHEIMKTAGEIIECNDVWLELYDSIMNRQKLFTLHSSRDSLTDFLKYSKHPKISDLILQEHRSFLFNDLKNHPFYYSYYNWRNNLRCMLAVPLFTSQKEITGILYLINSEAYAYDISDLAMVESYAIQASLFLENARLLDETLKQERMEQELRVAREVQINLLPKRIPRFDQMTVSAESLTAYEVGGDFYDFFQYEDGHYGFVLGDVSGKGTQAAFYMAEFKGIVQSLAATCNSPKDLAILSNKILFPNIETKSFITAIFAKFDDRKRKFHLVRSGHSTPVYFNATTHQHEIIETSGIGLGLDRGEIFNRSLQEYTIPYQKEHILFCYTDGLSELRNSNQREIDFNEIVRIFYNHHHAEPEKMKEIILNTTFEFLQGSPISDDLSFLIIKFN